MARKKITKKRKKILITGGAGFIGLHLANHLLDLGQEVTLLDNFFRSEKDRDLKALLKRPNIRLLKMDITDSSLLKRLDGGYDYVYHLAAVNGTKLFYEIPHEVLRINVQGLINVLSWFKDKNKKGKIMFISSNEAYAGALESFGKLPIPTPENVPLVISDVYNPRWSYGGSKLIGEQFCIHYALKYGFRMSIVRPHNFYGPRAGFHHVVPEFIKRIKNRVDPFPIYGAYDTRSFCYIDDAVKAMAAVMHSRKTDGQIYHIGSKEETKIKDLAKKLFLIAEWEPNKLKLESSPTGSVKRRLPDISKIKRDVGWEPETKLIDGLKETFNWYSNI